MRNKMRCPFWIAVGLATAVCWGGASLDAWSGEEGLTHAQKVDLARKVISAEPFVSGLGVQDDPFQFAKMSDTELRQYQQRVDRALPRCLFRLLRNSLHDHPFHNRASIAFRQVV